MNREQGAPIVMGLAGQPNVGKSTVFNLITGLRQHAGNWPGKTVERREGTCVHDGSNSVWLTYREPTVSPPILLFAAVIAYQIGHAFGLGIANV